MIDDDLIDLSGPRAFTDIDLDLIAELFPVIADDVREGLVVNVFAHGPEPSSMKLSNISFCISVSPAIPALYGGAIGCIVTTIFG